MANALTFWTPDSNFENAFTVMQSAARTLAVTAANADTFQTPVGARGLIVIVNSTAIVTAPSLTVTVNGYDPLSGATWGILTAAAFTGSGTTRILQISPHIAASANVIAQHVVPAWFNVSVVVGNSNSMTYSVSAQVT